MSAPFASGASLEVSRYKEAKPLGKPSKGDPNPLDLVRGGLDVTELVAAGLELPPRPQIWVNPIPLELLETQAMDTECPEAGVAQQVKVLLKGVRPLNRSEARDVIGKGCDMSDPQGPTCVPSHCIVRRVFPLGSARRAN